MGGPGRIHVDIDDIDDIDNIEGFVSSTEVSVILGVDVGHVGYLARTGHLPRWHLRGQQRWFPRTEVDALVAERHRWVSYVDAASIIGCSTTTVTKLVGEGLIDQRGAGTTAVPSLGRASVERVAQQRASDAAEREARRSRRSPNAAPDDGFDWIGVPAAAELLGTTANGLRWMCDNDRIPATRCGVRWWLRREQVLLVANAREARQHRPDLGP